jgi:Xaa-Pro aminopeptidase
MNPQIQSLLQKMQTLNIENALISEIENVRWLTGFSGSSAFVIINKNGGIFITDSRYAEQAPEQVKDMDIQIYANPKTTIDAILETANTLQINTLAFESEHITVARIEEWKSKSPEINWIPIERLIAPLRMIKAPEEIAKIQQACELTDATFNHVLRMLQPGITEFDISLDIEFYIRRNSAKLAFAPIVVSGPRSARPHGEPSERKLANGDFVTLDFGAALDGYCSDLTRTVVIGKASEKHNEVYHAVLNAQKAALEAMAPGIPCKDIDQIARNELEQHNLAKYFGHGLGHGLGRAVHDAGSLGPASKDILETGQVWTVEPGVYIEGFGGCRIEDDVVITDNGYKLLTHAPKHLMEL